MQILANFWTFAIREKLNLYSDYLWNTAKTPYEFPYRFLSMDFSLWIFLYSHVLIQAPFFMDKL